MSDNQINKIVLDTVRFVGEDQNNEDLMQANESSRLLGSLDSMGVVYLLVELEEKISDELDLEITLADERAMSQKTSPFLNVKTLTKYVTKLVEKTKQNN